MMELPNEIIEIIANKLDYKDIVNFKVTCKRIYDITLPIINRELKCSDKYHKYKDEITLYINDNMYVYSARYKILTKNGKYNGVSTYQYIVNGVSLMHKFYFIENGIHIQNISIDYGFYVITIAYNTCLIYLYIKQKPNIDLIIGVSASEVCEILHNLNIKYTFVLQENDLNLTMTI